MAILYKANETDFNHLGLGPLNEALSILVTEERNGMFELEMKYPIKGSKFNELKLDRLIKADVGHNLKSQRFKIIRVTKPIDGVTTINAEHISYLTQDLPLKPVVGYGGTASQALNVWKNSTIDTNPFIVSSDITANGSGTWSINDVKNAREALGGVSGSILDTYGGEYRFDNYSVRLMAQRGVNSGALIAYGKNLVDLTQEESISETFTSIYPYATYEDLKGKEQLLILPEYFVDSEYVGNYARRRIMPVDFSDDKIKDVTTLRSRAISYMKSNRFGIPKVNIDIKYVDLAKTLDYKDLALLEEVNLCDNVFVYFEDLDINTSAKIIKTVWDDLLEQYDSIEVGEAKSSLSNSINATVDGKLETVVKQVNTIQSTADGLNIIYRGVEQPLTGNIGDLWYEPDGIYENMYQWDGSIWKLMLSTRDLGVLKQEVTTAIGQIEVAKLLANKGIADAGFAQVDATAAIEDITAVEILINGIQTNVAGKADKSQFTQLSSDINLRVTKASIMSQLNLNPEGILLQGANILLDGNVTMNTAFIGKIKAIDISADRITAGTLNASNVNIINLNASKIATGTITGVNSAWNLNTGLMEFKNPTTLDSLFMNQGEIKFENGNQGRYLRYQTEGLRLSPYTSNVGTNNNTSLHLIGGGVGSHQYIQFSSKEVDGINQRLFALDHEMVMAHGVDGALHVRRYGFDDTTGKIITAKYETRHATGKTLIIARDTIDTERTSSANIYIRPSGAGVLVSGNDAGERYNVVASDFVKQSTRISKTDIKPIETKGLDVINRLLPVSYKKKDKLARGIIETELGFISEDNPEIATLDGLGVYDSHINAYLVKAVQELNDKINILGGITE